MSRGGRLAVMAAVLATALGCSVAGPSGSPLDSPIAAPSESPTLSLPPSASPSAGPSATPIPSTGEPRFDSPIPAAAWFLEQSSARFDHRVDLYKPGLPDEATALSSGTVDPAGDRGTMRFDILPEDPRLTFEPFDITWDQDDYWTTTEPDSGERVWKHVTRAKAPEMAMIGRVNEEPLALLRFVAEADPASIEPLPPATIDGVAAERWLIPVRFATIRAAFVPPDTYLGFDRIFGLDALPLEAWLVDGRIVRLGYVLEREKAPYGGPDRNETWYAWTDVGEPIDLVIPPAGKIVEVYD
jgi:hypothetical protein